MGAFTYPRSEPGSAGHMDLVERLNAHTTTLQDLVEGLPESALAQRTGEGEWSIKEIVAHLSDDGRILHERLYRMIKLEDPRLEPYDQDVLAGERDVQATPIEELLDEFSTQRAETIEMLADLVHWNWARTGRHGEFGRLSIRQLVDRALAHDETHLEQIRRVKVGAGS